MARQREDLYFMLNPALGIIKIGISIDVESRRLSLEHTCGCPLEVLAVVEGGSHFERELHDVFAESRLRGEWFSPTAALMGIIDDTSGIPALIEREADAVRQRARLAEEREAALKAADREERERAKEELRRLREEERRVKAERAARAAARKKKQEEVRRAKVAAEMEAWRKRSPDLAARLIDSGKARDARERREWLASQRARNAALVGVKQA